MQAGIKRGRGRPKKDASNQDPDNQVGSVDPLEGALDEQEPDVKRGRGRPKKDASRQSHDDQPGSVDRLLDMLDEPEAGAEVQSKGKAKNKRGRPPKEKADISPEEVQNVAEASLPAKQASLKRDKVEEESEAPAASGEEFEWAEDPTDERLTVTGAKCDTQSRLILASYNDLKGSFAGEPPPERHPSSNRPGLRRTELPGGSEEVSLDGLRSWRDTKGEGWIAERKVGGKNETRWISARTWGSWRLVFLLARLQQQVWKQAASGGAASSAAAAGPPAAEASGPKLKVLGGRDEWLAFSPKEVDLTLCLARTWNGGQGGQCRETKAQGGNLCPKHQTQAVSTRGLLYGFVDGPMPDAKLTEFQNAALRIAAGFSAHWKKQRPQARRKHDASSSSKGKGAKKEEKVKKHKLKVKLKHTKVNSKFAALPSSEARNCQPPEADPSTRALQSIDAAEMRRRRDPKLTKQDTRANNRRFWTGVDSAMDAALAQQELDSSGYASVRNMLDAQGLVNANNMGNVVKLMDSLDDSDARLDLATVLRRSVQADPTRAAIFVTSGGVGAVRPWLQLAMPQSHEAWRAGTVEEQTKREQVVLECLALLSGLPVTYGILQQTAIGRTLTALRTYCDAVKKPAERLILQWQDQFQKTPQARAPATSLASSPPAANAAPSRQATAPTSSQLHMLREPPAHMVPPSAVTSPYLRPEATRPPARPEASTLPAAPSIMNRWKFAPERSARRRYAARLPQNSVKETLRELCRLGEVLDGRGPTETHAVQASSSSSTVAEIDLYETADID